MSGLEFLREGFQSLFGKDEAFEAGLRGVYSEKTIISLNSAHGWPTSLKKIRKSTPILFYKIGIFTKS